MTPLMTKVGDWMATTFTSARSALGQVRDAIEAKAREVSTLEAEKTGLQSLRAPRAELLARLDVEIATLGREWATGKSADLVTALSGALVVSMQGEVQPDVAYDLPLVAVLGEALTVPALAFFAPELVRAGGVRLLDAAPKGDEGPAMAGRVRRFRELQAEIRVLEEQHQNLVDAATELGLTIAPLESNRTRRLVAQRQQEQIDHFNTVNHAAIARGALKAATTPEEAR